MTASFRKGTARELEIVQAVRAGLAANGFSVVCCNEGTKGPAYADWPNYIYDPTDPEPAVPRTFNGNGDAGNPDGWLQGCLRSRRDQS